MSAGEEDAGLYDAGEDGTQVQGAARGVTPPVALVYLASRDYQLSAAGLFLSQHPIDQRVRLALLVKKGSIPAAPEQGFDWTTPFAVGEPLRADGADRIHSALARARVTSLDVLEVRIEVESAIRGRVSWRYSYKNLQTRAEVTVPNG